MADSPASPTGVATVTPSATSPKALAAKVTVKPTLPVAPAAEVKPPAPSAPSLDAERKAIAAEKRKQISRQGIFDNERKEFAAKAAEYEAIKKQFAEAKLNPAKHLESLYGDKWYDEVTNIRVNGVPTQTVVADEIAKLRTEFEKKFEAQAEGVKQQQTQRQQAELQSARREVFNGSADFWKTKGAEYPALEALGTPQQIAQAIAQRVESEFMRTAKFDENKQMVQQGKALTSEEAAQLIENDIVGVAERVASGTKYQEKLRAKFVPALNPAMAPGGKAPQSSSPATTPNTASQTQRKTLSNDLTGSTPGRATANNEKERVARALAAFETRRKRT